jgi:DNA-binding response OmpR family regulator
MRILVIEDEPRMLELLRKGLQEHDCAVMTAIDGETGLEIANGCEFDAILLDIGLPRRGGYEVIRLLRESACPARVLVLTARDAEDDIIRGLELGADDYMTKPFSFPELVARLQSITRSHGTDRNGKIEAGDLIVDPTRRSVIRANRNIDLSRSEFSLLVSLIRRAGQCVPRKSLIEGVWGSDSHVGPGALDVLVNSLRGKVDAPYQRKLIRTVRRSGYMLNDGAREMEIPRR